MPGSNGQDSSGGTGGDISDTNAAARRYKDKRQSALRAAGASLMSSGQDEMDRASSERITPVSYKKGGRVKKTGLARLHKGEYVVPRKKVKRVKRAMKRMKARA